MQNKRKPSAPAPTGMAEGPLYSSHLYKAHTRQQQARIEQDFRISPSFAKFYAEELDTSIK